MCVRHTSLHTLLPLPPDRTLWALLNSSLVMKQQRDRDAKWRQMVDGSGPLTPVIRYGHCNWPALFSINKHYGPLCWPAPLVALLFLETPGSNRASVLALHSSQVISSFLLSASLRISEWSLSSLVKHAEDHEKLDQNECLSESMLLPISKKRIDQEIYYSRDCYLSFVIFSRSRVPIFIQRPPDALVMLCKCLENKRYCCL